MKDHHAPHARTADCDGCDAGLRSGDDWYSCAHGHCHRDLLCVGCIYECSVCEDLHCRQHITETAQADGAAVYVCQACADERAFEQSNQPIPQAA